MRARLRAQTRRGLAHRPVAPPVCQHPVVEASELIAALVLCSPFLCALDSGQIRKLVLSSWIIRRRRDEVLFAKGDAVSSAFLVLEGAVAVEHSATALSVRVEPGGVLCTSTSMTWLAMARAESEVRVLEIPRYVYGELSAAQESM